jgi:hypothetical protein
MIAQRPPVRFKGNAYAAQKSLHGNAKYVCFGENYEPGGEKSARRQAAAASSKAQRVGGAWGWAERYGGLSLLGLRIALRRR